MQKNNTKVFLAPMAGVGDSAFRILCKRFGADVLTSEMISAKAIWFGDQKTRTLARFTDEERPILLQLFGNDPDIMAYAAKELALNYRPDGIDINMGCPVPKIVKNHEGSALMRSPELVYEIVASVKDSIGIPLSVKIRKGFDNDNATAVQVALAAERAGADLITVHGRTREQMYSPPVDLDIIREVKQNVKIPVVGNGDIDSPEKAAYMLAYTGCDHIMVGRASLGRPWIFSQIKAAASGGIPPEKPDLEQLREIMKEHLSLACQFKREGVAVREARTQIAHYIKGISGSAGIRQRINCAATKEELYAIIENI